jgi:uncharacterized ferritin-like protein (DUF455 family)
MFPAEKYERFKYLCDLEGVNPVTSFQGIVKKYTDCKFGPPFNIQARDTAGMSQDYYIFKED